MGYTSKKIKISLFIDILTLLFSSTAVRAEETYDTGDIAANRAAEQKAALAKKLIKEKNWRKPKSSRRRNSRLKVRKHLKLRKNSRPHRNNYQARKFSSAE